VNSVKIHTLSEITIDTDQIVNITITNTRLFKKDGNFGRFEKEAFTTSSSGNTFRIPVPEARQLVKYIKKAGKQVTPTKTVIRTDKWIHRDRALPEAERRMNTIKAIDWYYQFSDKLVEEAEQEQVTEAAVS
jgi:hypothetical protein